MLERAMEHLSPEVLATVVAENFGDSYGNLINAVMQEVLRASGGARHADAIAGDRKAASALCLERQALWEATEARPTTPEHLRAEARARANEAAYVADAIASLP